MARFALAVACALCSAFAQAQVAPSPSDLQRAIDAERQAREREQRQRQILQPAPDVRLTPEMLARDIRRLPSDEQPCFRIHAVLVDGTGNTPIDPSPLIAALAGPDGDDAPQGRCLGAQGVALLIQRAQDALIAQGFVTSRVLAPPQDLSAGQLLLQVLPGRIARIRLTRPDDRANLSPALPMAEGDVLQLRDVEQALENLKRVPTAEVDIQIEPGQAPATSDLVLSWSQSKPWRLNLSFDDNGSDSSGKYQGSATLSFDHPLKLNDLFYLTLSRDLGGGEPGRRGTRGFAAHYSVPLGYWLLAFNASRNRFFQTVTGATQDYIYSGVSSSQNIQLSQLFHRDAVSKSSWSVKAFARQSKNFIDDTEVEVQRRRVGGFELGLEHKTQWGPVRVEGNLSYKRGTRAFGANEAPEERFGEGTHRFKLWAADAQWSAPLTVGGQRWLYRGSWRWQHNRSALTPQDRFSIGGRHTVRGFDGTSVLLAERGWISRNELSTASPLPGQHFYVALDHGQVAGPSARNLLGQRLTGFALGLRGRVGALNYDVFVGTPVRKPAGFRTANTTYGFGLSASF